MPDKTCAVILDQSLRLAIVSLSEPSFKIIIISSSTHYQPRCFPLIAELILLKQFSLKNFITFEILCVCACVCGDGGACFDDEVKYYRKIGFGLTTIVIF